MEKLSKVISTIMILILIVGLVFTTKLFVESMIPRNFVREKKVGPLLISSVEYKKLNWYSYKVIVTSPVIKDEFKLMAWERISMDTNGNYVVTDVFH